MKILQIINSLGTGGAEKLLLELLPLYKQAGVQMDVLLLWDNDLPFTQELKKLDCCKIYILKKSASYRDIYKPSHILKIRKIIKDYDIVHVHLFPAQYFVALANIGLGKTLVFTEHNTTNSRINNPKLKALEKWCYKQYQHLVCISQEIYHIYDNYLGLAFKSSVINNGVNLETIYKATGYPKESIDGKFGNNDFVLLQVSAFRPQKDQDTLIKSLLYLPQDVKLCLVGDGERRKELKELVDRLELNHRVVFLGQRMDIPNLLKSSDVIVLSSHYEGLSLASVEGLASGKPFVASDVPGLSDIVKGAGLLFPLGDDKKLAEIILDLKNNPEEAKSIAEKGLARAQQYDIQLMLSKHLELYKSL